MSYVPTDWKTGDVVTAEKLNKIETALQTIYSDVAGKIVAPSSAGVNGQILISDGDGGTEWQTLSNASTSSSGLMSATDKVHLDDLYADYSSALTALGVN